MKNNENNEPNIEPDREQLPSKDYPDIERFLNLSKLLTGKCFERRACSRDLCPMLSRSAQKRQDALKQMLTINSEISEIHDALYSLEQEHDYCIGVSALIGPENAKNVAVYAATILLLMSRLSASVASEINVVNELMEKSAHSPMEALAVRDACAERGVLNRWIQLSGVFNVDTSVVEFSDRAFSICLGRTASRRELALSILKEMAQPPAPRSGRRPPF